MPTAIITLVRPGPRMVMITIASRMSGKASITSISAHDQPIGPAAEIAGQHAQHRADDGGDADRDQADGQRDARARQHAAEHIAPGRIGAEGEGRGRRGGGIARVVDGGGIVRRQ